jgi:threonylcarbamoyladenosine tRNA methylthiotransferase MtaB
VSRDPNEVAEEISQIVENGTQEIIITGIQLGSYEWGEVTLAGLIKKVSAINGLRRLRLGSLEPFGVTEELLRAARDSEIFCRHLHLPLQSGDDGVLASMRRGYTTLEFARVVEMARTYLGDETHISTDIIVGFHGESEDAFANSLALLEALSIGKVHVFPYSVRLGTEASLMAGEIPRSVVKERMARAIEVAGVLLEKYASGRVGCRDSMLVENVDDGVASGWVTHYLRAYSRVHGTGNGLKGNELVVSPKNSISSILLCDDVESHKIVVYPDE